MVVDYPWVISILVMGILMGVLMWQDLLNGLFELIGGSMVFLNCRALYRDKIVRGVNPGVTVLFTSWGLWNLYYYPHLDQWISFSGGLLIVGANALWLSMLWHYRRS